MTSPAAIARSDIASSLKQPGLAFFLAWEDIQQSYARTFLGPWWIVLSTGIAGMVMGFVIATLLGQPPQQYVPFMVCGLLVWSFLTNAIGDSYFLLIHAAPIIRFFPVPIFTHYLRFVFRNLIILLHNLIILVVVLVIFPPPVSATALLALPGLLLDAVIVMAVAVLLSLANLRYRDTRLAVANLMQLLSVATPVFWDRGMLKNHRWIADANPFYHMVQIVRAPLLGQAPSAASWLIALALAAGGSWLACCAFIRYRHRIILYL